MLQVLKMKIYFAYFLASGLRKQSLEKDDYKKLLIIAANYIVTCCKQFYQNT